MIFLLDAVAILATGISTFLDVAMTVAEASDSKWAGWCAAGDNTFAWVASLLGADSLLTQGVGPTVALGGILFVVYKVVTDRAEKWSVKHVGASKLEA